MNEISKISHAWSKSGEFFLSHLEYLLSLSPARRCGKSEWKFLIGEMKKHDRWKLPGKLPRIINRPNLFVFPARSRHSTVTLIHYNKEAADFFCSHWKHLVSLSVAARYARPEWLGMKRLMSPWWYRPASGAMGDKFINQMRKTRFRIRRYHKIMKEYSPADRGRQLRQLHWTYPPAKNQYIHPEEFSYKAKPGYKWVDYDREKINQQSQCVKEKYPQKPYKPMFPF